MPTRNVTVPALVMDEPASSTSTVPQWFPTVPGTYRQGEPFPLPEETTDDQIREWIEASGGRLKKTTATMKVETEKPLSEYTVEELDAEFGARAGYPTDGKKADKLAFAQDADTPSVPTAVEE